MGFNRLKAIEEKRTEASAQNRTEGRNIAVRVTSYDLEGKKVLGTDIQTGEEVSISLRPDPNAANRKFQRAEVPDWSGTGKGGKRNKSYTEEGGVILFEGVYAYPEGLTARWGTSISHTPDEANVMVAYAQPFVARTGKKGLEIINPVAAQPVKDAEELKSALTTALDTNPFSSAMVRAFDGEEVYTRQVYLSKKTDRGYVGLKPAEAAEEFMSTEWAKGLVEGLESGTGTVEVFSVEKIFAGKDTQESLGTDQHFQRMYVMGEGTGFAESIITTRRHAEGGQFLSSEPMPVSTMPKLYAAKNIPTPNIQPKVAPFVNGQAQDNAAQAEAQAAAPEQQPSAEEQMASVSDKVASAARALGRHP